MNFLDKFIQEVSKKNELQKKYLETWEATKSEKEELNTVLRFFMEELHYDMDYVVESYLFINDMVMQETYYFAKNKKYRHSSFKEVYKIVYDNPVYMEKYMVGLSISDYIWINHIKMLRYFKENMALFFGESYLEIGPGFGQFLCKALLVDNFKKYSACDISKTSVDRSNRFLAFNELADKCQVEEKDFFEYSADSLFDCIVMGEVLEHVENPFRMLEKIHGLLKPKGKAFITTVINAPAVDHIYLFENAEQVLDMAKKAGFSVFDYICVIEGDIPIEIAKKTRRAIDIAMILGK